MDDLAEVEPLEGRLGVVSGMTWWALRQQTRIWDERDFVVSLNVDLPVTDGLGPRGILPATTI